MAHDQDDFDEDFHLNGQPKSKSVGRLRCRNPCTKAALQQRLPVLEWARRYTLNMLVSDVVAGITVGLTIIPQSLAYAAVAGLPLQYGLYSSFMGPFLYVLFGTVKELSTGPTAVMALMTFTYASAGGPEYAVLIAFLAGCIELLAGLLNLGFLVDLISSPVMSGFCSAAALTVFTTQVKGLTGLKFSGSSFVKVWSGVFTNFYDIRVPDVSLGLSVIVVLLLMRKMTSLKNLKCCCRCLRNVWVDRVVWFVATSRNAFAVIGGCIAAYYLEQSGYMPFTLTGDIEPGLPSFQLPHFTANRIGENGTSIELSFGDILSEIGSAVGLIPLIAILEQIAIAKAFANGGQTNANQEMIALGIGSIVGSFFGSMAITASFGRSSVMSSSGVQTTLANAFSGTLVILALAFLMPALSYIPKPILAAVIMSSVIFMVEIHELPLLWRGRRLELLPWLLTFFCCLFINIEFGMLIGAAFHLVLMAYLGNRQRPAVSRTTLAELRDSGQEEQVVVRLSGNVNFPAVEALRHSINKATASAPQHAVLVLDVQNVVEMDFTTLKMLDSVARVRHKKSGQQVQVRNASASLQRSIAGVIKADDVKFVTEADRNV